MPRKPKHKLTTTKTRPATKASMPITMALPANNFQLPVEVVVVVEVAVVEVAVVAMVAPPRPTADVPTKLKVNVPAPAASGWWAQDVYVNNLYPNNPMEEKEEKVFYKDQVVQVTQSRFVTNSKTFAMRNISSVTLFEIKASRAFQIFMIIVGALLLINNDTRVFGIVLVLAGALILYFTKDSYSVRISSNSGESDGFISKDKELVQKIVSAVNDAIIHRG
jgi:hypothetical protein